MRSPNDVSERRTSPLVVRAPSVDPPGGLQPDTNTVNTTTIDARLTAQCNLWSGRRRVCSLLRTGCRAWTRVCGRELQTRRPAWSTSVASPPIAHPRGERGRSLRARHICRSAFSLRYAIRPERAHRSASAERRTATDGNAPRSAHRRAREPAIPDACRRDTRTWYSDTDFIGVIAECCPLFARIPQSSTATASSSPARRTMSVVVPSIVCRSLMRRQYVARDPAGERQHVGVVVIQVSPEDRGVGERSACVTRGRAASDPRPRCAVLTARPGEVGVPGVPDAPSGRRSSHSQ
jgi:hypothetical protein